MKNIIRLSIFLILLFNLSCSTIGVAVDFDKNNDFSTYKTYKWIKQKMSVDSKSIYLNNLNRRRFALAIENELKQKEFERTEDKTFDFSVVYHLRFDKKLDVTAYGYKYYPSTGYARRYIQTRVYQKGSIILDIIDRKENILVWRGVAEGVLSETDNPEETINRAIKAILKDFPPQG
jgi:phage pi2 protein 07